jgi:HemY protein
LCKAQDWQGALATLALAQTSETDRQAVAQRRRAVLLAAKAQEAEDGEPERALELALEAHKLAPDLVPAAAIAGRVLAHRETRRAPPARAASDLALVPASGMATV